MVNRKEFYNTFSWLLKRVFIVELIILFLVGLCWWLIGNHTKDDFINTLFIGGAISIMIGVALHSGSRKGTYDLDYHHVRGTGKTTNDEYRGLDTTDMNRSFSEMMVLSISGLLLIALGVLIDVVI